MVKYVREGWELSACGTCLDSRDLEEDDLRPRSTMGGLLALIETADEVVTIGQAPLVVARPGSDRRSAG